MERHLIGASRMVGPYGRSTVWKCLVAGISTLGIVPVSVQAQGIMGSMRKGTVSQPRPPVAAAVNPYTMNSYRVSPSMSGNSNMYGDSSLTWSGTSDNVAEYGGQGHGDLGYGQPRTGQAAPIAAATLFGLPAENGRVQWPLGLRILKPADETRALREQLELVLYFAATQAAEGHVNRTFIDFGLQAVRDLRQLLRPRAGAMPAFTYSEGMRFLDRAERGLTKIRMIETSSDGANPQVTPN